MRTCALHDYIVSRRLERLVGQVDVVHAWPLGSYLTLRTAARLGIPTVLERPNAHTAFAYEVVRKECDRLGIVLPTGYEHAFNAQALQREEQEYAEAFRILCPSEFTARTFLDKRFAPEKLARHIYGYDQQQFYPSDQHGSREVGLNVLFVGVCAVRKGLHFALEAWLRSEASRYGMFSIAGDFLPAYKNRLSTMLAHPSVRVLGQRRDIPELMRRSDILVLPSIEEGFGLVVAEAASAAGAYPWPPTRVQKSVNICRTDWFIKPVISLSLRSSLHSCTKTVHSLSRLRSSRIKQCVLRSRGMLRARGCSKYTNVQSQTLHLQQPRLRSPLWQSTQVEAEPAGMGFAEWPSLASTNYGSLYNHRQLERSPVLNKLCGEHPRKRARSYIRDRSYR